MTTYGSSKGPTAYDTGAGGSFQGSKPAGLGPSVENGRDGPYNPIESNWSTPGSQVYGGETYHGHNAGPASNNIKPLPASSTNPGQSPDGGQYTSVGWAQKDGLVHQGPDTPTTSYTDGIKEDVGYKVLGRVDITDRPLPNSDPNGAGNWSFEQASYFGSPDYNGDKDRDDY